MSKIQTYGQYCPLAMSAEFLCQRWTILILREIFFGSHSFNDIARGVPRMSRTLLSNRLKELTKIGVIKRSEKKSGNQVIYQFTQAGEALKPVVMSMAEWAQKWLQTEPSLKDIDVGFLMWDIRRNTVPIKELPDPFIVHFYLTDVPDKEADHWLIFEDGEVDLCHVDRDFDVDVTIEVSARDLTATWMGWEDFDKAVSMGQISLHGPERYTKLAKNWLGQSTVANVQKATITDRVKY